MNDTTPNIAALVRERLLSRTGVERVVMGSRMFDVARAMALASFPPGLSEVERKGRLCERLYGNEVDVEAYIEHLLKKRGLPHPKSFSTPPSNSTSRRSGRRGGGAWWSSRRVCLL